MTENKNKEPKREISSHEQKRTFVEDIEVPEHIERSESNEFRQSKEQLKKDGHDHCFICGTDKNLQVHHFLCEWSLSNDCDEQKLREMAKIFDPYGYGKQWDGKPITMDSLPNLLVLCQEHHTHPEFGIHCLPFNEWIMQRLCKTGDDPVIEDNKKIT